MVRYLATLRAWLWAADNVQAAYRADHALAAAVDLYWANRPIR